MIQTVEREATNNLIVKMLTDGRTHKEIAKELGVGVNKVGNIARVNNLERHPKLSKYITLEGNTLEDLRRNNPFKIGDKVIVKDKNGVDATKSYNCVVEKTTDYIVFARGDNSRMYTVAFPTMGMDSEAIVRR